MEIITIQLDKNQEMCAILPAIKHLLEKWEKSFCTFSAFKCFIMPKTGCLIRMLAWNE